MTLQKTLEQAQSKECIIEIFGLGYVLYHTISLET